MESLSCGTPVVVFDIGGNKDMITHKVNGYLAQDIDDLKRGIAWILELDSLRYQELCDNARKSVLQKFDARDVANSYVDTYKKMIASYKITLRGGGYRLNSCVFLQTHSYKITNFSHVLDSSSPATREFMGLSYAA